jgi:transcriptional regulator of heat shock response
MNDRTALILKSLIDKFIISAAPISSQKLLENSTFEISSATVRNEFASLEEIGMIKAPHISAGKIPTEKGFRYFVDELLEKDEQEELAIKEIFFDKLNSYKKIKSKENIFEVLQVLASCSEGTAFAVFDDEKSFYLGLSNVLRTPEFHDNPEFATQIIEALEDRNSFVKTIQSLPIKNEEIKILIGEENLIKEITSCSLLVTKFNNKYTTGHLGIIGPTRMNYARNRAILENIKTMIF